METISLTPQWELAIEDGSLSLVHVVGEDRYILEIGWCIEHNLEAGIEFMKAQGLRIELIE
jgi:hypothetical protein